MNLTERLLILMALSLALAPSSWAQVSRSGGIHDGGGTGVYNPTEPKLPPQVADRFPPLNRDAIPFEPKSEPVDLVRIYPELRAEVALAISLLQRYGLAQEPYMDSSQHAQLDKLIFDPEVKYYVVPQFPDVPECRVPRDNSGVPHDYESYKLACTRGNVTLLLDHPQKGIESMSVSEIRNLLAHEAFRRWPRRLATSTIEVLVRGMSTLMEGHRAQLAGNRDALTRTQLENIRELISELRLNGLTGRFEKPVDMSVSFAVEAPAPKSQLYRIDERSQLTAHGGLLVGIHASFAGSLLQSDTPQKESLCDEPGARSCISESAMVGIGTLISGAFRIGADVTLLYSRVENRKGSNQLPFIRSGTTIINSSLEDVNVGARTWIMNSQLGSYFYDAKDRSIGSSVRLENVQIKSTSFDVGNGVEATRAEVDLSAILNSRISIGHGAKLKNATVKPALIPDLSLDEAAILLGPDVVLNDSVVEITGRFEQERGAQLNHVRLRARPFDLGNGSQKQLTPILLRVGPEVVLSNTDTPIIFLGDYRRPSNRQLPSVRSSIEFHDSIDFKGAMSCPMGIHEVSRVEVGIRGTRLVVRKATDLTNCQTTAPIPGPPLFSRAFGWGDGYFLSEKFLIPNK